jgi:tetratricopeptide (TPR) repeat protein
LNPNNADTLYELGQMFQYRGQSNVEKAEEYYIRALAVDPQHKNSQASLEALRRVIKD